MKKLFFLTLIFPIFAHSEAILDIDPNGQKAVIMIQEKMMIPGQIDNTDALTLFQGLKAPDQGSGATLQRDILSPDQTFSVECTNTTGPIAVTNCLVVLSKSPNSLICFLEQKI